MPFRETFDCLWCGRPWQVASPADLEGWAGLCPECLGRAGDNAFLAYRLRSGLSERSRAAGSVSDAGSPALAAAPGLAPGGVVSGEAGQGIGRGRRDEDIRAWFGALGRAWDDRYLRRGRYSRGPVRDLAWTMELDLVTGWLDRAPLRGDIVELAAGTGWWSPLLASKGDLSLHDVQDAVLDVARERLVAHGLRAHLHVRDAWAEPERVVDALFTGHWLSLVPDEHLPAFLGLARRWLRPGGTFAFIDRRGDPEAEAVDDPPLEGDLVPRRLPDGRWVRVPQVAREPDTLSVALRRAGFDPVEVTATPRFFVMGVARRP